MISINKHCTGCSACANICPVDAISMSTDEIGFIKPVINEDKCIGCNLCEKTCPILKKEKKTPFLKAYWVYSKDVSIVMSSSSGGVFGTIAKQVLKDNGIVFGCAYNEKEKKFICCDSDEVTLEALMRSKYTESYINMQYRKVKKELHMNRKVLFCGTPCQVAGLKSYLKKEYNNLWTMDFSCEGVPAQNLFWKYISDLEKNKKSKAVSYNFRDKFYKWGQHCISIGFEDKSTYREIMQLDPYFCTFIYSGLLTRYSCHECMFADQHYSDIVLADFWKYKDFLNVDNNHEKGLSLILIQTPKGQEIFESYKDLFTYGELELNEAVYNCKKRSAKQDDEERIRRAYAEIDEKGLKTFYKTKFSKTKRLKALIRKISYWK